MFMLLNLSFGMLKPKVWKTHIDCLPNQGGNRRIVFWEPKKRVSSKKNYRKRHWLAKNR